jgi:AcrR family transcriptional regulator
MPQVLRTKSRDSRLVEEKRKIIIDAALKVFSEKSYAEATVQEIADAAGMTIGNVYRYIGSKQDILNLICLESKGSIKDTRAMLANLNCENVTETLKKAIRAYVEGSDKLAERHLFYNREIRNFSHEDRAMLLQSQTEHVEFFEELIRKGIAKGEFETDNALLLAHNIVLIPHDWVLRRWFLRKHFTLEEYITAQTDIIMKSLVKKSGGNAKPGEKLKPNLLESETLVAGLEKTAA